MSKMKRLLFVLSIILLFSFSLNTLVLADAHPPAVPIPFLDITVDYCYIYQYYTLNNGFECADESLEKLR